MNPKKLYQQKIQPVLRLARAKVTGQVKRVKARFSRKTIIRVLVITGLMVAAIVLVFVLWRSAAFRAAAKNAASTLKDSVGNATQRVWNRVKGQPQTASAEPIRVMVHPLATSDDGLVAGVEGEDVPAAPVANGRMS